MKKVNIFLIMVFGLVITPTVLTQAADFTDFKSLVDHIISAILKPFIPFIIALTVGYFWWGVTQYVVHTDDLAKREEGRKMMLFGVIAIAVMVSFWGLAKILVGSFGF